MMRAKVIFLDFDGVLLSADYINRSHYLDDGPFQLDPLAVARLNQITDATGAGIVITSTRRIAFLDDPDGLPKIALCLSKLGITGTIIGMTPDHSMTGDRGTEITEWLSSTLDPDILVLDDNPVPGYDYIQIQPDFQTGLLDHHVRQAIQILGKK